MRATIDVARLPEGNCKGVIVEQVAQDTEKEAHVQLQKATSTLAQAKRQWESAAAFLAGASATVTC